MKYTTIFTILEKDTSIMYPTIIFFVFTFIILFILKYNALTFGSKIYKFFASLFIFFLMIGFIYNTYFRIIELKEIYKKQQYKLVEGRIKNYIPEVQKKHDETFQINDINFSISSNTFGGGFHTVGKVYNGLKVRIYYIENKDFSTEKIILRIDKDKR